MVCDNLPCQEQKNKLKVEMKNDNDNDNDDNDDNYDDNYDHHDDERFVYVLLNNISMIDIYYLFGAHLCIQKSLLAYRSIQTK